ncbi:ATPase PAAT isoform 2-T2 [Syngnathus typhle]
MHHLSESSCCQGGNTSNLMTHLECAHGIKLKDRPVFDCLHGAANANANATALTTPSSSCDHALTTSHVDVAVKMGPAWRCQDKGRSPADVMFTVDAMVPDNDGSEEEQKLMQTLGGDGVLLERADANTSEPCVLMLSCGLAGVAAIGRLTIISEARTMEVYLPTGEYCGTVRGQKQDHVQDGDRGPFYRKQLDLNDTPSSCDVKLLSLAGRSSVLLCGVVVAFRPLQPSLPRDAGAIDLQQVQSLVNGIGGDLSPGAQNLMDMLHFQQKNQSSFLPLLMGGGLLSSLATPPCVGTIQGPADLPGPAPPAPDDRLAQMTRRFLSGSRDNGAGAVSPDLLRELCAQLTPLKLERNNTQTADVSMERRLEEMERRLKEHVDRRLDALEHKLDRVLLGALQQGEPAAPMPDDPPAAQVQTTMQTTKKGNKTPPRFC